MLLLRILGSEGPRWAPWDDTILTQKMSGSQVRRSGWTSAALLAVSSLAVQGESWVSIFLTFLLASQQLCRDTTRKERVCLGPSLRSSPSQQGIMRGE